MKHTHGGDIYKYADCVDFSANCNPLGTPEGVLQAVRNSAEKICHYPQVGSGKLREAIAGYEGVSPDQVICGNGAAEVVFSLCQAVQPKKALLPAPAFAEYEQALQAVRCEIGFYLTHPENAFSLQADFPDYLTEDVGITFLCNPNNPTGILTERDFLIRVLEKCREKNILMVLDECFLDFIEDADAYTMKSFLKSFPNLFLLKAFTKRYGMAGVRLGYGLTADESLLEAMQLAVQPWNVSVVAQEAGLAALQEEEFVREGRKIVFAERVYLMEGMKALGFHVFPSQANYIFFQGPEDLFERCLEKGFLIRDCSNYRGLHKGYYRTAVKLHHENEGLLTALREIVGEGLSVRTAGEDTK